MLALKYLRQKKSVVLNNDEPRPVQIPKDFAHIIIRKIDEAYIEFIDCHLQFTILYFIRVL